MVIPVVNVPARRSEIFEKNNIIGHQLLAYPELLFVKGCKENVMRKSLRGIFLILVVLKQVTTEKSVFHGLIGSPTQAFKITRKQQFE